MKILVAYDGSINSQKALKYGLAKVQEGGGSLRAVHVFNRSMFIDYGAGPKAEEMGRGESAGFVGDARRIISEAGAEDFAEAFMMDGNPQEEIVHLAGAEETDLILVPPKYKSVIKQAPCPVSVVPGNIILPVDNTDSCLSVLDRVVHEATETGSQVIVLGIVPIHLYSPGEKQETDRIKKETETISKKVKSLLLKKGIEVKEILRAGYPDEEIVKAADEYPVTMIIVPESGDAPSELAKAANIIIEDSDRLKKPVLLVAVL